MRLHLPDLRDGYITVVNYVNDFGRPVDVRGQTTIEMLDVTLEIDDPTNVLPVGVGRGLNLRIAALEALQLIGGVSHPELMVKASPNFAQFLDGGSYHGAYGPRVRAQLPAVVDRLKTDLQTRQAVVTLWEPARDLFVPDSRDYPCTTMLQFLVRDGALQLHTTMRSNDVWLGLAYDAFQFTQLQLTVAAALGIPAGPYFHHAVSMHMYERDVDKVVKLQHAITAPEERGPLGIHDFGGGMLGAMQIARRLLRNEPCPSTAWYAQALKPLFA